MSLNTVNCPSHTLLLRRRWRSRRRSGWTEHNRELSTTIIFTIQARRALLRSIKSAFFGESVPRDARVKRPSIIKKSETHCESSDRKTVAFGRGASHWEWDHLQCTRSDLARFDDVKCLVDSVVMNIIPNQDDSLQYRRPLCAIGQIMSLLSIILLP